jgi:hypothetical protein
MIIIFSLLGAGNMAFGIAKKMPSSGLSATFSHAKAHGRRLMGLAFSRLFLQMGEGARRAEEGA